VFLPCDGTVRAIGRVAPRVVPAVELATLVHRGSHANIDLAYGSLATMSRVIRWLSNGLIGKASVRTPALQWIA
jgi:hypothetical protein